MAQMGTEVADAVTVVRDQAQALLNSVNQLIGVVNEPEIQQALIDVRDGLQRVVDQFNQTGMRDIDSLIEIVGELRASPISSPPLCRSCRAVWEPATAPSPTLPTSWKSPTA